MEGLDDLLQRLEDLITEMEQLDEPLRAHVFELLDGIDAMHRLALDRLAKVLGTEHLDEIRGADPAIRWLLDAYGAGDQRPAAEAALESIRPYIHSHGGKVEILEASAGIVRLRLSGSCSGCTASAVTLQHGVEEALRNHLPGFVAMDVEEEEEAPAHAPPGPTLVQIQLHPPSTETRSQS